MKDLKKTCHNFKLSSIYNLLFIILDAIDNYNLVSIIHYSSYWTILTFREGFKLGGSKVDICDILSVVVHSCHKHNVELDNHNR